jgi:MOSC domain-containing protein YiiM
MNENIGSVLAVCRNEEPGIPKHSVPEIRLLEGLGVEGDYHAGKYVRHRYLQKKEPERLNNRQVLLIDTVILEKLRADGVELEPGQMGENIVVEGADLMSQEIGTRLQIGETILKLSEVRDPCAQLNASHPDLLEAVQPEINGQKVYIAGIFAEIQVPGRVFPGDPVQIMEPGFAE